MYSEEYLRDLETSAHLDRIAREQEQEKMLCPVCGRKIDKWVWRTTCCGAEIVWTGNGKETMMEDIKIDMTNQEAIKALQEFALNYGLNNKMIDAFGKAIRALEEQPEWISVSDKLPTNANIVEKEYLVRFTNGGMTVLNYYDGWNCFVDNDGIYHNENEIENVLFWMELPKPKEVDSDDGRAWLKEAFHNFFYGLKHTPTEEDIQAYIDVAPPVTPQPITLEKAIDYLHEIGWMQEHDKEMAQPKVGEWLKNGELCKCSRCGSNVLFSAVKLYNFCYRCGAKMEVEG